MVVFQEISHAVANDFVGRFHRHNAQLPRVQIRFSVGMIKDGALVGVAMVGNPCGRTTNLGVVEVRRVCFHPSLHFGQIRRHYSPRRNGEQSLRYIPVIMHGRDDGMTIWGRWQALPKPREIPSLFMQYVEAMVDLILPSKTLIWTYIRYSESGIYLDRAGYEVDKTFTRNGIEKRRFSKTVCGVRSSPWVSWRT